MIIIVLIRNNAMCYIYFVTMNYDGVYNYGDLVVSGKHNNNNNNEKRKIVTLENNSIRILC